MRFGKSVLSQYLRTKCDLALYLTLFRPGELQEAGLPNALEARPGTRSLRDAGIEQETTVYGRVRAALGDRCIGSGPQGESNRWTDQPLATQLNQVQGAPSLLIQPSFSLTRPSLEQALQSLGVLAEDIAAVPGFEGFIPDILLLQTSQVSPIQLSPSGDRIATPPNDPRMSLAVVDVKHAHEANPSYEAEVVLYALLLAQWLVASALDDRFYVSADVYLWTRGGIAGGHLSRAMEEGGNHAEILVEALKRELSPVNLAIYVPAIRRFFGQTMPQVLRLGGEDWTQLEWHVAPSCASCDWLGYEGWLGPRDRPVVAANPRHYCFARAAHDDDVGRIPLITRGSRRVLQGAGFRTVAQVAGTSGAEGVYGEHTNLKADRRAIPGYAVSVATGTSDIDPDRADGMLARYADLDVCLSINFDPGAGLLTGIGLLASFTQHFPFGQQPDERVRRRWREHWVVAAKGREAEESTVLAFLQQLASIFEHVNDNAPERGGPHAAQTRTQIVFWSRRQFEELCVALGRHLPAILYDRQDRLVRALAWIFPPEELQELDENAGDQRPTIAFVRDTVRRLVRVPALHALTLFNVADVYHYGDAQVARPDHFYREPLSDTIPRERIYEIWALSAGGAGGVVRWGPVVKTFNQLLDGFARTIDHQTSALISIVWRLRGDFGPRLKAEAPRLRLVVPTWANRVAHDSKLWIAWARFEAAVGRALNRLLFTADPEEVEASSDGLRLLRRLEVFPDGRSEYEVSEGSLNSKLRAPSQFLCLSVDAVPGFLALPTRAVIAYELLPDSLRWMTQTPMYKLFAATLVSLDRTARRATVAFEEFRGPTANDMGALRAVVLQHLQGAFEGTLTLVPGLGPDVVVRRLERILAAVGDPPIAEPAPETLSALGAANRAPRRGNDPDTALAQVLWRGRELSAQAARPPAEVERIVRRARDGDGLNDSQAEAVRVGAGAALTVVWGPPGTGKTKTCAALLHGLIAEEARNRAAGPYNVLVTGPTYKAVGELVERLVRSLGDDGDASCQVYLVYSPSRPDRFPRADAGDHIEIIEATSDVTDPAFVAMRTALEGARSVVVVATVTHQCARIAEQLSRMDNVQRALWPLFDFVLIDETSQVDMTTGVMPLALLKQAFQLVVAGDHLQMPPIVQAEPPLGAEYLVGSIQSYLTRRFGLEPVPLLRNYRSGVEIVSYTRRLGYPDGLEAANPGTAISLLIDPATLRPDLERTGLPWSDAWARTLDPQKGIVALTYPDGRAGQANEFEAACVAAAVWLFRQCTSRFLAGRHDTPVDVAQGWDDEGFWNHGIGIVTPHRAQRAQIVRLLSEVFRQTDPALIEGAVDTVERFQGGERHTIIISFGVGDPDVIVGEERFLLQLERTNVAISRAMGKCVVLLSDEVANHIPEDRRAAMSAHALRGVVDEWCVQRHVEQVQFRGTLRPLTVRWRG
jgi:hypothetical protein